ncbi:AAA family ATPase [Maridesulfovibrio sp.]|uniref:AAA family ATPase n=1 Tax=Maridesulfovibrio sp. TaxID=2795000 RepID=UPI002A189F04|nr:AAA family ATPase [Maridesulfovibrio sp.]
MASEIKRIDSIKNMAVFQDFCWSSAVKDNGGNPVDFKQINILYGRNYSGKTTLSRIIRALEVGEISDKYDSPLFQLSFHDGSNLRHDSLQGHDHVVRVFNEDFVKDNLQFIVDDAQEINSFAILGEDNAKLEEAIEKLEFELGSEEKKTGLYAKLSTAQEAFKVVDQNYGEKEKDLNKKLQNKATKSPTSIKNNKMFGDVNYNTTKLKRDIGIVIKDSYDPLSDKVVDDFHKLLKEDSKDEIKESAVFNLKYSEISSKAKNLIEKKIQASDQVQEWLDNTDLAKWVESGRKYHKSKRNQCAFCGSLHPAEHWEELWGKLDKHFNQESKDLEAEIDDVLLLIDKEKGRARDLLKIEFSDFYSSFDDELKDLLELFATRSERYSASFASMKLQLEDRKNDIFTPLEYNEASSVEHNLNEVRDLYESIREESNLKTQNLEKKQSEARKSLRLHSVFKFTTDINYKDTCTSLDKLEDQKDKSKAHKVAVKNEVDSKIAEINELKSQLKDESKGAEQVNHYLNNFFGHHSLSLRAVAVEEASSGAAGYRFEITRNGKKAFHLSEGECSLIAFCYFMAKLEDIETKGSQPIIWIDDPISSLDTNHIFFIYTLIASEIIKKKSYRQLFISTHSLDFLKYLKRISGDYRGKGQNKVKIREFFLIERCGDFSRLSPMPRYLKEYVTEFNYLFHQIYKCATCETLDDASYQIFYNFGNNARKFLEIYLYYKYPNGKEGDNKISKFFGEGNIPILLTERINNEYSHLCGVFERGASPIDVPEMKTVARQIILKIKEDSDQYSALLESIGVQDDLMGT